MYVYSYKLLGALGAVALSAILVTSPFIMAYAKSAPTQLEPSEQQATQQADVTIVIPKDAAQKTLQEYYQPIMARVSAGDTVQWKNEDAAAHTATARDGSFGTGLIPIGSSGFAIIRGEDNIPYYCIIHPWMTATLQVSSSSGGAGQQQGTQNATAGQQQNQQNATAGQQQNQQNATNQRQDQPQQQQLQTGQQPQQEIPRVAQNNQQPQNQTTGANQSSETSRLDVVQKLTNRTPAELADALQQVSQMYQNAASSLREEQLDNNNQSSSLQPQTGQQSLMQQNGSQQQPAGGAQQQQQGSTAAPAAVTTTSTITIPQGAAAQTVQQYYQPQTTQVSAGSKVTWQNQDYEPHTATARDSSFDTSTIAPGQSGSVTVQGQGKVDYYCTIHPWMTGTLQVDGGPGSSGGSNSNSSSQQPTPTARQQSQQQDPNPSGILHVSSSDNIQRSNNTLQISLPQEPQQIQTPPANSSSGRGATVTIARGSFSKTVSQYYLPDPAEVSPGKIVWNNQDLAPHTATATDGSFDTGVIQPGQSGSAAVQGMGRIYYYCTIHPWMTASIQVFSNGSSSANSQQTQSSQSLTQQQASNNNTEDQTPTTGQQEIPQQIQARNQSATEFFKKQSTPINSTTPIPDQTETGLEEKHKDNWITVQHDIVGTRTSNQTTIGKDNVNQLQLKWILNNPYAIENPPLIVGNKGYALDNGGNVIAFDTDTGDNLWKVQIGSGGLMHGMTYDNGIIFSGTGGSATVVAIDATNGTILWESPVLGPKDLGYGIGMSPIVWNDLVVVGSAGGDLPPHAGVVQGNITALNRTNGEVVWNFRTTEGGWVSSQYVPPNGGGTAWSGGSFDPETGMLYFPVGNATPDFNGTSRDNMPLNYTNRMVALNLTDGKLAWATPFIEQGTVLNATLPDTHDWDTAFGSSVTKVTFDNGTERKVVIGHDKRGDIIAMDAETGKELWWKTVGVTYRTEVPPKQNGSGEVWPGTQYGVEAYHAVSNNTLYVAVSNMGFDYYVIGISGYLEPKFDAIDNGIGNGTIMAIDMRTGDTMWEHPTPLPTWVSPAVTNGVVLSGHITDFGKPYEFNTFGAAAKTPLLKNGIILALDQDTGKELWSFKVGGPVGIGGPSIGNGMLFVTTGSPAEIPGHAEGSIVAFGLPPSNNNMTTAATTANQTGATAADDQETQRGQDNITNSTNTGNSSQTMNAQPPPANTSQSLANAQRRENQVQNTGR